MQKKGDKVDNKTNNKERKEGKKDGEREIRKICLFFLQNSFLAIFMLISRKPVQRRGIGEKQADARRRVRGMCWCK